MKLINKILITLGIGAGVWAGGTYLATTDSVSKEILSTFSTSPGSSIPKILTIDGKTIAVDEKQNIHIPYKDIPKCLLDALLATEDKNFRNHESAMDQSSFFRKAIGKEGFSGIATQVAKWHLDKWVTKWKQWKLQQLVYAQKNLLDNPLLGATPQERKQKILEMYINETPSRPWGNKLGYLCKRARGKDFTTGDRLDPRQAAILVAWLKASGRYNAFSSSPAIYQKVVREEDGKIIGRGVQILKNMVDQWYLSAQDYEEQKRLMLKHVPVKRTFTANEVKEFDLRVEQAYSTEAKQYMHDPKIRSIELTIDAQKQALAQNYINARLNTINNFDLSMRGWWAEWFGLCVKQDGQIERYVPWINNEINSIDVLTTMRYFPWSKIKPILIAYCLQKWYIGINQRFSNTPQSVIATWPEWYDEERQRTNVENNRPAVVSLESILRYSLNCGIADVVNQASKEAGWTNTLLAEFNQFVEKITGAKLTMSPDNFIGQWGMSMTPKQFIKLYLMLANDGKMQNNLRFVEYTTTLNGQKKSTYKNPSKEQIIEPRIAKAVLKMIADSSFWWSMKTWTTTNHASSWVVAITRDKKVILVGYLFPQANSDPYRKLQQALIKAGVEKDSTIQTIKMIRENNISPIYLLNGKIVQEMEALDRSSEDFRLLPEAHKIFVPLERINGTSWLHAKPMILIILREVEKETKVVIPPRKPYPEQPSTDFIIEPTYWILDETVDFETALTIHQATQKKIDTILNASKSRQGKDPRRHTAKIQSTKDKTKRA